MAASETLPGRRYDDLPNDQYRDFHESMDPGGYRRVEQSPGTWIWEAKTPNGLLGSLRKHEVVEHENGTISVSPSIQVDHPPSSNWHGFLERGVWREV